MKTLILFLIISISLLRFPAQAEITAEEISAQHPNLAFIELTENMIPVSDEELTNGVTVFMAEEEKDIIITGDDAHLPKAFWIRPNILALEFPAGSSCHTEYSVEFPPHRANFLSGKPMKQTRFTVRCPGSPLGATQLTGMGSPAFLVMAMDTGVKEAQNFSEQSAVRYFLCSESGKKVEMQCRKARLRHVKPTSWEMDCNTELSGIPAAALIRLVQQYADNPAALTADTPLPQTVIIQAPSSVSDEESLSLVAEAAPESGIQGGTLIMQVNTEEQFLQSSVCAQYGAAGTSGKPPVPELKPVFNTPLTKQEFLRLFHAMRISIGGQEATPTEGEESKTAKLDNRTISIQVKSQEPPSYTERFLFEADSSQRTGITGFSRQSDINNQFIISLQGATVGDEIELTIPTDAVEAIGYKAAEAIQHRVTIREPRAQATVVIRRDGTWELLSMGMKYADITCRRIPAEAVIPLRSALRAFAASPCDKTAQAIAEAAEPPITQRIVIDTAAGFPQSTQVDKAQLCGGSNKRGLFLLHLSNRESADNPYDEWLLLNDSDLEAAQESISGALAVYHQSTGEAVSAATVTYNEKSDSCALSNGLLTTLPADSAEFLFIRSGEDYLLPESPQILNRLKNRWEDTPHVEASLLTDRKVYLPGDTALVWGMIHNRKGLPTQGMLRTEGADAIPVTIRDNGSFSATLPIPTKTGWHHLHFSLNGEKNIAAQHFIVMEEAGKLLPTAQGLPYLIEVNDNRIRLYDTQGNILDLPVTLRAEIYAQSRTEEKHNNGLILYRNRKSVLFSGEITIPAHCRDGICVPMTQAAEIAGSETLNCEMVLTMKDSDGNNICRNYRFLYTSADSSPRPAISAKAENGELHVSFLPGIRRETHGILLVNNKRSIPVFLKAGQTQQTLPLLPHEVGELHLNLLFTPPAENDLALDSIETRCVHIPREKSLHIRQGISPAETGIHLRGRVTTADGVGAPSSLCLYIVDVDFQRQTRYETPTLYGAPRRHPIRLFDRAPAPKANKTPRWEEMADAYDFSRIFPVQHSDNMDTLTETYFATNYVAALCHHPLPKQHTLNPFYGKNDFGLLFRLSKGINPLLHWESELRTDENGDFSVPLPHRPGTYRVYTIAAGDDGQRLGLQETEITIP